MIEESAVVARIQGGQVWVERAPPPACGPCQEKCSTALFDQHFRGKPFNLSVDSDLHLSPGDRVVIGLREETLLKGALIMYLLPLAGLFLGAGLGKAVGLYFGADPGDWAVGISAGTGLMASLVAIKCTPSLSQIAAQPQVLRRDT
jgi:sigma-E factor negative regulatory protein RseC